MAAAIGAGMKVEEAVGCMVVDIGGGTTEIALISLSGVVYRDSIRVGGDRFDEAIVAHVRRRFGCLMGDSPPSELSKKWAVFGLVVSRGKSMFVADTLLKVCRVPLRSIVLM